MALELIVNGAAKVLTEFEDDAPLEAVVVAMNLKSDRVAVEHNGVIASRVDWGKVQVRSGDRLEVVHFVGGGGSWA